MACPIKYMTFNSSCSYAGLANMLLRFGVDTQDREIALSAMLPFLFAYEEGEYRTGPMLQSAQWFNLYLHPRGLSICEKKLPAGEVAAYLRRQRTAMLGLHGLGSGKHAVVYVGSEQEKLLFINNKREHSDVPAQLILTPEELTARMDDTAMVAVLERIPPCETDIADRMRRSLPVLRQNTAEICALCEGKTTAAALRGQLDRLFRALLLDGITMLELLEEQALAAQLRPLQQGRLRAVRQEADAPVCLRDYLPPEALTAAAAAYARRIEAEIDQYAR